MNHSPAPQNEKRSDRRRKLTAQLHERELDDLDYILAFAEIARTRLADLDLEDEPVVTIDMPDEQRLEVIDRLADYELRAEFKRTFGTLDLPDTKADVARLALRLLARTIKDYVVIAGQRAAEADPVHRADNDDWAATGAAMMDAAFDEDEAEQPAVTPLIGDDSAGAKFIGVYGGDLDVLDPEIVHEWARHTRDLVGALSRGLAAPAVLPPPGVHFQGPDGRDIDAIPLHVGYFMQVQPAIAMMAELHVAQVDLVGTMVHQFRNPFVHNILHSEDYESMKQYLADVADFIAGVSVDVKRKK